LSTATLPFTVFRVEGPDDLDDACLVRAEGYGRHLPALRDKLLVPDELDFSSTCAVFLARDKATGRPVGTMRAEASHGHSLMIEQCAGTADFMRDALRAEISRLAAVQGAHPQVKIALMKASFLHCLAIQARWMVIGARSDALVRQYKALGFTDMLEGRPIALGYAGNLAHRVLAFDVARAERHWHESSHALYTYMFETCHPDISVLPRPATLRPREPVIEALAA